MITAPSPGGIGGIDCGHDRRGEVVARGSIFQFTEATSFQISCEPQEEVDYFWDKLTADSDPAAQQCCWVKDQFGP